MTTHKLGIIMNGVTGRMGTNQHLLRSIKAIIDQGGVKLSDSEVIMPDPILIGRSETKLAALAARAGVKRYSTRLDEALANNPGKPRPIFAMMRHTAVYDRKEDWMVPVKAAQRQLGQFENLFKNLGDVKNGFPKEVDLGDIANRAEYDPNMLSANLMFGTPDEVIAKLRPYETLGVDQFTYYASLGLGHKEQKRSLELFCKEVIPAFS